MEDNSNNNKDLNQEEQELLRRLTEIRKLQQEKQKLDEERKKQQTVVVEVYQVQHDTWVNFKLNILRPDFDQILRGTYNRTFTKNGLDNNVHIGQWVKFLENIKSLPNVEVIYTFNVEDEINHVLNGPHWIVDLVGGQFKVLPTAVCINQYIINSIPSAKQRHNDKHYTIQQSEAHLIAEKFAEANVVYSKTAQDYMEYEIRVRSRIDQIALKEDSPEIKVPFKDGFDLKGFQRVAVEFAEVVDCNFIDADEMGLGKTVVAIAVQARNKFKTLVVVPASLKTNWYRMFEQFVGVKTVVLNGVMPDQSDFKILLVDKPDVVIINYEMLAKRVERKLETVDDKGMVTKKEEKRWYWAELLSMAQFDLVVFDEGHKLKNVESLRSQASRQLKARRFMPLTGTPVTNRPHELWPLLALVAPEKFPNFEQFTLRYSPDGKTVQYVEELRDLIKPYVLRRLKRDVIKELPPINRIMEYHELSDKAKAHYAKVEAGIYEILATYNPGSAGQEVAVTSILAQLVRMKQITTEDKLDNVAEFVTNIIDQNDPSEENNKVIVFSQFKGSVSGLIARLNEVGVIGFDGMTPMHERTILCDRFQNDKSVNVLVTTTKVAGEGLTLTRAGSAVFTDLEWTPAAHEQAEARAYGRVNDLHSINSYYFIATNTIDEWIWELLQQKLAIIRETVDAIQDDRQGDISIANEIIKRLRGKR